MAVTNVAQTGDHNSPSPLIAIDHHVGRARTPHAWLRMRASPAPHAAAGERPRPRRRRPPARASPPPRRRLPAAPARVRPLTGPAPVIGPGWSRAFGCACVARPRGVPRVPGVVPPAQTDGRSAPARGSGRGCAQQVRNRDRGATVSRLPLLHHPACGSAPAVREVEVRRVGALPGDRNRQSSGRNSGPWRCCATSGWRCPQHEQPGPG
jgi:hypothetical protein